MWTTEIIICLVADHAWTMEIVQEKRQYIKKNNKNCLSHIIMSYQIKGTNKFDDFSQLSYSYNTISLIEKKSANEHFS